MTIILNLEKTRIQSVDELGRNLKNLPILKNFHLFVGNTKVKDITTFDEEIGTIQRLRNF
jgi:hypothetical protein